MIEKTGKEVPNVKQLPKEMPNNSHKHKLQISVALKNIVFLGIDCFGDIKTNDYLFQLQMFLFFRS